jgi:hypothetical protein
MARTAVGSFDDNEFGKWLSVAGGLAGTVFLLGKLIRSDDLSIRDWIAGAVSVATLWAALNTL